MMLDPHDPARGVPTRIACNSILIAISALLLFLLTACGAGEGDAVESTAPARTVAVTGTGQLKAPPDVTLVMFGFWVKEEDANLAIANSAARLGVITNELNNLGISTDDIDTPGASMNSEQIFGPDGYPTERLLYAVNQNLTVTVRDSGKVGDVLNTIRVTAGAPYLFSLTVQAELSQERRVRLLAEAQRLALADALAKGNGLAQQLGLTLGQPLEVIILSESVIPGPILQSQVSLQVRYALED